MLINKNITMDRIHSSSAEYSSFLLPLTSFFSLEVLHSSHLGLNISYKASTINVMS